MNENCIITKLAMSWQQFVALGDLAMTAGKTIDQYIDIANDLRQGEYGRLKEIGCLVTLRSNNQVADLIHGGRLFLRLYAHDVPKSKIVRHDIEMLPFEQMGNNPKKYFEDLGMTITDVQFEYDPKNAYIAVLDVPQELPKGLFLTALTELPKIEPDEIRSS